MTVTVQSALSDVQASARRLSEAVRELVLIAVEDQPRNCQVHLVTVVHDAALDVAAEAEQAAAAENAEQLMAAGPPEATAASAVADCQHHVTLLGAVLVRDLAAPELLNDLAGLSRERGGEVRAWVREILRCIQAVQIMLWTDIQPALLGYWRELADAADRTVRPAANAELEREGRSNDGYY
jgi:hypothetical protein